MILLKKVLLVSYFLLSTKQVKPVDSLEPFKTKLHCLVDFLRKLVFKMLFQSLGIKSATIQ